MSPKTPLPILPADPDARLVRWGWIAWAVLTGYLVVRAMALGGVRTGDPWTWLAIAPIVAVCTAWPLARGGRAAWRWMRAAPLAAWNGSYFEFEGRQIRVLFDDEGIFLVAEDAFAALDLRHTATAAARVRLAAGRDGLRTLPQHRELVFTERGLIAWLERRQEERAVRFRRWLEREVLAPYRRRRNR